MKITVYQTITIRSFSIGSLANSSVLQIGSAGLVKGLSNNYNTGGFTGPAPGTEDEPATQPAPGIVEPTAPLVPLPALQ